MPLESLPAGHSVCFTPEMVSVLICRSLRAFFRGGNRVAIGRFCQINLNASKGTYGNSESSSSS